jgi:hypothetical protein
MATAWCLIVCFVTPWVAGAPVLWLVRGCRTLRATDWLWAPFLGLAALVGTLQPLTVFADLPLQHTAPAASATLVLAWTVMLICPGGRASLRRVPVSVLVLSGVVYLVQGLGVLVEGVEHYRGNMQSDQYQYAALTQFLTQEPFSTSWATLDQRPWLIQPMLLKADRLGQSVIHGFLAVVTGQDALTVYFPTQALGPALLVPAVLLLAAQLQLRHGLATLAAAAAALAPGTTTLQSLCFLSQVLCVPVLIAFVAGVVRLSRGGSLRPLPGAGACFALGFAVYTEFVPLFLGAAAVALVTGKLVGAIRTNRIAAVAGGLALAAALSPAAAAGARSVWERSHERATQMTLEVPTPVWAVCAWVNTDSAYRTVGARYAIKVRSLVAVSFVLTAAGVVALAVRTLRHTRVLPAATGAMSLLVPPLVVWALHPGSVYLISKLLLTASPILVLFVACAARALGNAARRSGMPGPLGRRLALSVFGALAGFWSYHTVLEQSRYLDPADGHTRAARLWNDPELVSLCQELSALPGTNVVLALDEEPANSSGLTAGTSPSTSVTALCFTGRHHKFWLAGPERIWCARLTQVPAPQLTDLSACPRSALVVLPAASAPPGAEVLFRNELYALVRWPNHTLPNTHRLASVGP